MNTFMLKYHPNKKQKKRDELMERIITIPKRTNRVKRYPSSTDQNNT